MTKKEAIQIVTNVSNEASLKLNKAQFIMLDDAIRVLSEEPVEGPKDPEKKD